MAFEKPCGILQNLPENPIFLGNDGVFEANIDETGKYHCTVDLLFDWTFGISCMKTDNFCFYLQNRLIQTSQTGGQWYSDTSPLKPHLHEHWHF